MAVYAYKDGKFELIGDVGIEFLKGTEEYKNAVLVEVDEKIETVEDYSGIVKKSISQITDSYIQRKLSEIDEDLADLVSEKSWLEGVFASRDISPEQVRNETVLVVLGKKTIDQAITDLSIPEDLKSDFERAVEIARIIAWKEAIWKAEEKLESQIDSMTFEGLLSLNVKKICEDTYSKIPLEV